MKTILAGIISICMVPLALTTYAQTPKTQIASHTVPDEARRGDASNFKWSNGDEFIISNRTRKNTFFTVYDGKSMKKTGLFSLENPEIDGKNAVWVARMMHQDMITSVYSFYDKKDDMIRVYGKIEDRKNRIIRKETVLMESYAKKRKNIGSLEYITSNDLSKILVFREPAGKKYEDEKIEMALYDNDLKKIWTKELSFPYTNGSINIQDIIVTNEGMVSIVAFWRPSKQDIQNDPALKDQITFKIFGVTEDNEKLEEIQITEKGYALSTCKGLILNDSSNDIVFSGYYLDEKAKRNNYSVNGIYYIRLNTSSWKVEILKFNQIEEKTLIHIMMGSNTSESAEKHARKEVDKGYGIRDLEMKRIISFIDGSIKIISQVEYVVERCYTDSKSGATRCSYYYHNNQIVEFHLSADGGLKNTLFIPKLQMTGNNTSYFNGHILLLNGNQSYYIYNDNDANFNPKKLAKRDNNNFYFTFNGSKKSRLCYTCFDKKGQLIKTPMTPQWKQNILIYPESFVRLDDKTIVTWGKIRKGKELILIKVYLE